MKNVLSIVHLVSFISLITSTNLVHAETPLMTSPYEVMPSEYFENNQIELNYVSTSGNANSIETDGLLFLQLGAIDNAIGVSVISNSSTSITLSNNNNYRTVEVYFNTDDIAVTENGQTSNINLSGITFIMQSRIYVSSDFFEKAFGFNVKRNGSTINVNKMIMDVTVTYPGYDTSYGQVYMIQKDGTTYLQLAAVCNIIGAASVDDGLTDLSQKKVVAVYGQKKATANYNSSSITLTSPEISPVTINLSGHFHLAYIDGYLRLFAPVDLFSTAFGIYFNVTPTSFSIDTGLPVRYYAYNLTGTAGDGITDDGPEIQTAITQALQNGGYSVLVFPPNKSFFLGSKSSSYPYFIIEGKSNFSIEGNGSTLLLNTKNSGFKLKNCTNSSIRGLNIDFEEVPYIQGVVISKDTQNGTMDVDIDSGHALPPDSSFVSAQGWPWNGGGGLHGLVFNNTNDGPNAVRKYASQFSCTLVEKVQGYDRRYRFTFKSTSLGMLESITANDKITYGLGHLNMTVSEYYTKFATGNFETFDISRSSNITLEDNNIYGSLGMGVRIADNDGRVTLRRTNIQVKPGTARLLSTPSDGVHTKNNRVGIIMDSCLIESTGDDSVNISTMYDQIVRVISSTSLELKTTDLYYCVYTHKAGDTLKFLNLTDNRVLCDREITDVTTTVKLGVTISTVTLDSPLDTYTLDIFNDTSKITRILNMNQRASNSYIMDCVFRSVFRNTLFGNFDGGYIIGNVFDGQRGGIIGLNFCGDSDVNTGAPHVLPYSNDISITGNEFYCHKWNAILHLSTPILDADNNYLTRNIDVSNNFFQTLYDYIMVFQYIHNLSGSGNFINTTVAPNKQIIVADCNGTVYREIDGAAPTISSLSPADGISGVAPDCNLDITFSEAVTIATGNIAITNLDAASATIIPADDAQISVSGSVLTINPTVDLATNTNYAVLIDAGAVEDRSGNPFAGITNSAGWNFTTGAAVAPVGGYIAGVTIEDFSSELTSRQAVYLVDGSGFNEETGTHVAIADDYMWVNNGQPFAGSTDDLPTFVTFDLGGNYELGSVKVWNWNVSGTLTAGAKDVTISIASSVGGPFNSLGAFVFDIASGSTSVDFGQVIDLSSFPEAADARLVRFDITSNHGFEYPLAGLSEVRFLLPGTPGPTVVSLSPADDTTDVTIGRNLMITFNENIQIGSGNITITNLDTAAFMVIPVDDAQVSISGKLLTINPTSDLAMHANYAVLIDAGAVEDLTGHPFAGISDSTTWNFTTAGAHPFASGTTKVFLLAGQSNMKGQGINTELTAPYDAVQTNVAFWDSGRWVDLAPGFGNTTDNFGPEVVFGYTVQQVLPDENILLVKYAANGTALYNDWAPGTGPEYTAFLSTVNAALADLDAANVDYEIAGMLWLQGESDAHEGQGASYETNLRNFIADLRTQFSHPGLPFYIARVATYYGTAAQSALVRDAQVAIADDTFNVEWFDTDSYPLYNYGHYGTIGQIGIGYDFANMYLTKDLITTNWPAIKVMALGDSITAGYTDNPTWSFPFNFGYRSGLYKRLQDAQINVQFVGTSAEPFNNIFGDPTLGGTVTPEFDLRLLGQDGHEGYEGWNIPQIESIVASKLAVNKPDVITLMIGNNGISSSSPVQLNSLVSTILTNAPDVQLIIAQITPKSTYNVDLYDYNTYIRNILVPAYKSAGYDVSTVDLYTMYLTDTNNSASIDSSMFSNGINHPTPAVYDMMADKWLEGIQNLSVDLNYQVWISGYGLSGANASPTNDYDEDGINNLLEYAYNGNPTDSANAGMMPLLGPTFADNGTNWIEYVHVERSLPVQDLAYTLMASSALTNQFTTSTDAVFFGEAEVGDYKTVTNRIPTDGKSAEFLRMNFEYN